MPANQGAIWIAFHGGPTGASANRALGRASLELAEFPRRTPEELGPTGNSYSRRSARSAGLQSLTATRELAE